MIKHWPAAERPRERLAQAGPGHLSDAELLAILLGRGVAGVSALDLARHGQPPAPIHVTAQLEGQAFSVHAEGPRLILTRPGEVAAVAPVTEAGPDGHASLPLRRDA